MMGPENQSAESTESVQLDDDPLSASKSYSSYRSALSSLSSTRHPLSPPIPSESDHPADANNFGPFDYDHDTEEVNGMDSPGGESTSSAGFSGSEYLKITVSSPLKEYEVTGSIVPGGGGYFSYLINSRTNVSDFGGSEFSVRRRFKDVVALSDRLAECYRGYLIPPRPDKSVVESQMMQKGEFVEQRRVALEKYLRRLAVHPVIGKSDELRVFLTVDGKLPFQESGDVTSRVLDGVGKLPKQLLGERAMVGPQEVVQPAKGGRDFFRLFKEFKQSVSVDWGGSKPAVLEEDKEFLENKERIRDLEQHLSNASKQAELLVKAQKSMGETMGELGLSLMKLTKFENQQAVMDSQRVRAADMKNVATAAVKASRYYRGLNTQTVKHLDTLHEHLNLNLSVHSAFSDRSSALLTVQTLQSELSSLHSKAEKLEIASSKVFGFDKSRLHKVEELKETIKVTEDAKNVAVRQYERIKDNNKSELERFDRERKADLLQMLKGYVVNQIGYHENMANLWTKVAEDTSGHAKDRV